MLANMDPITKKEIENIKQQIKPEVITPRISDVLFRSRNLATSYASTGGSRLIQPDVMLEFEWQGRRYVLPAFEKKL